MAEENDARGRFVWYDLMTPDPEAAKAFYTSLLGWGTTVWENEGMSYTMWTRGETPLGGVMPLPGSAEAPPHWLAYVAVPDVAATVARASELGGKVWVPATEIPGTGSYAVLADPQGATFGVYASQSGPAGEEADPEVGEFSWHELTTTDYAAASEFYADLFGWEKMTAMDMGPMGIYQIYGRKGRTYGGMFNKTPDMPFPPNWLHYVRVDDVHRVAEKVKELGGQILNGPMEVPGGDWIAQCMDPQGTPFAVHEKKSGG
jgi:uncharacterized protein